LEPDAALHLGDTWPAMPQENVEIVRRLYDAFARADFELALSYLDPEIEFSQPPEMPGGRTYHGPEGVIQGLAKWLGASDGYVVQVQELIDLGDQVVARTRHRGRGKGSGVELEQELFDLVTLNGAKIVRISMYLDEAQALEAAGLRP
jgi:ketosteroid isomerase-like protein